MAEETKAKTTNSSFPFFKLFSFLCVIYLVILGLGVNIPFINRIPMNIAFFVIAGVLFFNMMTGGGEKHIKDFKRNMIREWKK